MFSTIIYFRLQVGVDLMNWLLVMLSVGTGGQRWKAAGDKPHEHGDVRSLEDGALKSTEDSLIWWLIVVVGLLLDESRQKHHFNWTIVTAAECNYAVISFFNRKI